MLNTETKVGLFALAALLVIGFITIKIGSRSFVAGRGYEISVIIDHAIGVKTKTPVEIAGIKVGQVKKVELFDSRRAKLTLLINGDVSLPPGTKAVLRAKGFLGETLVELLPGSGEGKAIEGGSEIGYEGQGGDVNMLLTQFSSIAGDVKAVSSALRDMVGADKTSPVWNIVNNLEKFTATLAQNQANFDKISDNLAELTAALRGTVVESRENVEESLARIASITKKVDEGKGTVGKLVNDDETVNKLNEAVDNLNNALGGLKQLETEIGYHTEYLSQTSDFKHYVNLTLRPKPDKAFIFDFVDDPAPSATRLTRDTTVTTGGTTTTVNTETATIERNKFRFSAQLAKQFYDVTVRGGVIESRGGLGLDYNKGPVGVQFSAFDFQTNYGERPHLKASSTLNVTQNFYLIGGADDMISRRQDTDWFFGAGLRLVDEDVKSLLSVGGGALKR
ncbi:MAG: MCE family protein [Deltaproteobacteria bacterium]|nr:MCE family protein [Deltaproteobacteria bacterium]MBI2974867.1 MCE family protein [Deltaproteobacteria bacterium]